MLVMTGHLISLFTTNDASVVRLSRSKRVWRCWLRKRVPHWWSHEVWSEISQTVGKGESIFIACLKVYTNHSARRMVRRTDFPFVSCLNSSEVNWGPLSDTICSGSPWLANKSLSTEVVFGVVVLTISRTSGHLE